MRERPSRILLKCRPTPAQLADRLAHPVPEGLELYLDAADLREEAWLAQTVDLLGRHSPPKDFVILVEGPIRSLDGSYFDLTADTEANREVVRGLAAFGQAVGAVAANIHAIAPRISIRGSREARRDEALRAALPLLRYYVGTCEEAGLRPLVENIPPVARMRENACVYTPIGMDPRDLNWLVEQAPGLGVTLDLSHAQLYLNALRSRIDEAPPELAQLLAALRDRPLSPLRPGDALCADTLDSYVDAVAGSLVNVHVSNASGLLGEGLPYDEGEVELDAIVARLLGLADYLVTETLEPDPERAVHMRDAQARMMAVRDHERRTTGAGG